jgi:hypothetical protein
MLVETSAARKRYLVSLGTFAEITASELLIKDHSRNIAIKDLKSMDIALQLVVFVGIECSH